MRKEIKRQAEYLGYEITTWDVEGIVEKYFHLIATGRPGLIRAAVRAWFA